MAKTSMKIKQQRKPKFSTREYTRCKVCGRPHSVLRKYGICRICFRELAYKGQIPGVKKAIGSKDKGGVVVDLDGISDFDWFSGGGKAA